MLEVCIIEFEVLFNMLDECSGMIVQYIDCIFVVGMILEWQLVVV